MNFSTQLNSEKPGNQWRGVRLFLDSAMTKSEVKLRSFSMYPVFSKKPRSVGGVASIHNNSNYVIMGAYFHSMRFGCVK